ncbi:MAG TPA: cyclodeaminase/cyclohydrolase family protein [Planctomycetota bacterium]|nr:cyclodeaminase/cyclohydrolase family protein [Planctomycetota bacterium]
MPQSLPEPLDDFARRLAAPTPAPGGGAAAARAGVYATALLRMVLGITRTRAREGDLSDADRAILVTLESRTAKLGKRFEELEEADSGAFEAYLVASRLPRGSEEEREARRLAMASAAQNATEIPLETATSALEVVSIASDLLDLGSRIRLRAESDIGVALELAAAAFHGANWNVRVNLPLLGSDRDAYATRSRSLSRDFDGRAAVLRERVRTLIDGEAS